MIDFHCHLDLYPDAIELLPIVAKRNQFTLAVTTSPRAWHATSRLFSCYDNIKVALGLHPEIATQKSNELPLFISSIPKTMFIGEIGIDGSQRYRDSLQLQEDIFKHILMECDRSGGRILSIHSRNAVPHVLDFIAKYSKHSIPVLHWFSGTAREMQYALELDCWFSIGPTMLNGAKGRALLNGLPINKILPETDGPFTSHHNKALMPWDAIRIADALVESYRIEKEDVYHQFEKNLSDVLSSGELLYSRVLPPHMPR